MPEASKPLALSILVELYLSGAAFASAIGAAQRLARNAAKQHPRAFNRLPAMPWRSPKHRAAAASQNEARAAVFRSQDNFRQDLVEANHVGLDSGTSCSVNSLGPLGVSSFKCASSGINATAASPG